MKKILRSLKINGFVKNPIKILSKTEINQLKTQIKKISKKRDLNKNPFIEICGHNKILDNLVEKILKNDSIQNTLENVLGKNYILWGGGSIRISRPNEKGLLFHQDAPGETGLIFLVNDQPKSSTVVFKSSHLFPRVCKYLSWNSPKIILKIKKLLSPLTGSAGDHFFWFYKTWHGRLPNQSNEEYISLFFPFFPQGTDRLKLLKETNEERVKNVNSNYIKNLMNNYKLKNQKPNNEKLCNKIEKFEFMNFLKINFYVFIFKFFLLEIVFFPVRILRVFK